MDDRDAKTKDDRYSKIMDDRFPIDVSDLSEDDKQILLELLQIQRHLWDEYGFDGAYNKKLQHDLNPLQGKDKADLDARSILMGSLIRNLHIAPDPKGQPFADAALPEVGFLADVLVGSGNSSEGRQRAREYLGLDRPVMSKRTASISDQPNIPGSQPILPKSMLPLSGQHYVISGPETGSASRTQSPANAMPAIKQDRREASPGSGIPDSSNPFSLSNTNLKQQVDLLERNPLWAKHMIMAAGRDPRFFGL